MKRLKYLVQRRTKRAIEGGIYLGLENIESGTGVRVATDSTSDGENLEFHSGDVLFGKLRPYLAKVFLADFNGVCTSEFLVLRPSVEITTRFLFYYLLSPNFIDAVTSFSSGAKMPRAEWDMIGNLELDAHPVAQQRAIADFLDREIAKIDDLIQKTQRAIQLLNEERTALISHTVTQGLDPAVPMKPSHVNWLGHIPEHWQAKRLKWAATMESGHTPDKQVPAYWTDGDVPWVSLNDTAQLRAVDYIAETAFYTNALGIQNSSAKMLPTGTVVFSRDATIGLCAITAKPMAVSQHFIAWICGPEILPEYLLFVLRSMTQELSRLTMGSTVKTIGMTDVRTLCIPVPPIAEQEQIVNTVKHKRDHLDTGCSGLSEQLLKLREYRAALISAAVTGQLDIRKHEKKLEAL